jgi:hypothetical protein
MSENITTNKMMDEIKKLVENYIDASKKNNKTPTRDKIIDKVSNKLCEIIEVGSEKNEIIWIASGVAIGIAIVLEIEEKLAQVNNEIGKT